MDKSIFTSFQQAVKDIFAENKIPLDSLSMTGERSGIMQVVSAVGITGDLRGNLIFGCSYESAQSIVDSLFRASSIVPPGKLFGDLQKATIGEFVNQIVGRALMNLANESIDCSMTPPTVITGDWVMPDLCSPQEEYASYVAGGFGSAVLRIGLKKV
jgi:CheY-specific phosphatase CheX